MKMQVNTLARTSMFWKIIGMQKILLLRQTLSIIIEYLDIPIYFFFNYQTVRKLVVFCAGIISLLRNSGVSLSS